MSATTTQLLSGGEFYKKLYDAIPVKIEFANFFFSVTKTQKITNFDSLHSCRKWAIYLNSSKYLLDLQKILYCLLIFIITIQLPNFNSHFQLETM